MIPAPDNYQAAFHRRWGHLRRDGVRALAWLLDAPDLLDATAPEWQGRVATLGPVSVAIAAWLTKLDADPSTLDAALGDKVYTRLGLYAEKLMAFYFAEQGRLVAHGLQIRASRNDTVGEFDFLLENGTNELEHIEFATKFYLLASSKGEGLDALVGPNLADSLGAKLRKIFDRQLTLSDHPAAQALLPRPVTMASALVKGWLFYPRGDWQNPEGVSPTHCHGFWCTLADLQTSHDARFVILPKLQWLAPLRTETSISILTAAELKTELSQKFETSPTPILIAQVTHRNNTTEETTRGFIVPPTWPSK